MSSAQVPSGERRLAPTLWSAVSLLCCVDSSHSHGGSLLRHGCTGHELSRECLLSADQLGDVTEPMEQTEVARLFSKQAIGSSCKPRSLLKAPKVCVGGTLKRDRQCLQSEDFLQVSPELRLPEAQ